MIYMQSADGARKIIVLETGNLERLKRGDAAATPDGSVLLAWTPDPGWLAQQLLATGGDPEKIATAIEESMKRPQQPMRERFDPEFVKFNVSQKGGK